MSSELSINFKSGSREPLARMTVFGEAGITSLTENGRYEYELDSPRFSLKEVPRVITHSRIHHDNERGRIEPGNYVGLLKLELLDKETGVTVSTTHIDIRSTKLGYEDEYRSMLENIADRCADFLLQLESPVEQPLIPDGLTEATLAQRLYFLKSLLGGEDFQQAIQRIVTMPNTQWREEFRTIDVHRSRRLGRYEVRQLASAGRRMEVPAGHPLRDTMETIPKRIEIRDKRDTVDTPENRFVKHTLILFFQTLEDLIARLTAQGDEMYPGLRSEITMLLEDLEETLSHDMFKQVSQPELLPLNSPVLQRKEGYRQVLRAWMLFELAARLSWDGGDDVYEGGKRDVAALYEYWVFFKLLDLVSGLFELKKTPVENLINDKDLVLKLKAGKQLPIEGIYRGAGRPLSVEFSYNRTFGGKKDYPAGGSWSRQMRPDYTLSLWPDGFTQDEAEEQELITHVHFDAKYKVDSLTKLFGGENENLDEEKAAQRAGNYKRGDLLKMHAYRDAIRRSAGAYVLYPGNEKEQMPFRGFHELLPGLGAFPLRPNNPDDGSVALERFLKEVVAHVCNRATQREQQTYHTYRIHKDDPPDAVREAVPERDESGRMAPAKEIFVIHGWHNGDENLAWVLKSGLYNFRTGERRGSLRLHHSVSGASYLLLHGAGEFRSGGTLFKITGEGPRIFSKEDLIKNDYPGNPSQYCYLMFDVEPLDRCDPLAAYDWDLKKIEGIDDRRGSPVPKKGIPLNTFMKGAVPKKER
ncbi:DUF2357 domain-containing protein [Pontiella agarivorans]|uniref:DUF2357 domain-containing protein n=1 Tax=Pontiella agarivorans TaxID=3038953 RepID=A0ABU5MVG1_9BACT|nr:DUF2357 domain-containing protein [Pontiella agarivorans]MDZ8118199.1 DUF2357 domain-containing protein [Pontiella agarivorans]